LKRRFRILLLAPEYNLQIQARIPAALCSIHNFIRTHDLLDQDEDLVEPDYRNDYDHGNIAEAAALRPDEPSARRDQIAQQMWDDYVEICNERNHEAQEDEEDGDELEGEDEYEDALEDAFEDDDLVEHDLA
jgi:hypothetical protein